MSKWDAKSKKKLQLASKGQGRRGGQSDGLQDALGAAREHVKSKHYDEAIKVFETIIEENPEVTQAYVGMGNAYAVKGEYDDALESYAGALHIKKDLAPVLMMSGDVYLKIGQMDKALGKFNEALEVNPGLEKARISISKINAKQGDFAKATSSLESALEYNPQSEEVLLGLAAMHQRQGGVDAAYKMFNVLLTYSPKSWKAHFQLGGLYLGQKKYDKSIAACKESIKLEPKDSALRHSVLGRAYAGAEQYELALKEYEAALEIDEKLVGVKEGIARVYKEQGKLAEAKEILIGLCKSRGNKGYAHLLLAEIMMLESHFDLAVAQYQTAVLKSEKLLEKYPDLAKIKVVEGDDEKTANAYKEAFDSITL